MRVRVRRHLVKRYTLLSFQLTDIGVELRRQGFKVNPRRVVAAFGNQLLEPACTKQQF